MRKWYFDHMILHCDIEVSKPIFSEDINFCAWLFFQFILLQCSFIKSSKQKFCSDYLCYKTHRLTKKQARFYFPNCFPCIGIHTWILRSMQCSLPCRQLEGHNTSLLLVLTMKTTNGVNIWKPVWHAATANLGQSPCALSQENTSGTGQWIYGKSFQWPHLTHANFGPTCIEYKGVVFRGSTALIHEHPGSLANHILHEVSTLHRTQRFSPVPMS